MNLIIVESPTKANTFNKYLKDTKYQVEATMGHVRDLPENKIAVDIDHNFKPDYILNKKKQSIIERIKSLAQKAHTVILATDADREGEAISYHIACLLGQIKENWPKSSIIKNSNIKRIVFHEITEEALKEAFNHPQTINLNLVNSQQTRRLLDRLVGYKLSPLLWKKIGKRWLSAGRVQTVALRFIVEREKEILQFKSESFYRVVGTFSNNQDLIEAKLISKDSINYEKSYEIHLFDGKYRYTKTTIKNKDINLLENEIKQDSYTISKVEEKIIKRFPPPPFITSSLQQDASRIFGYSSKVTMRLAQSLYEKGLITYHRTDSFNLAGHFLSQAKQYIAEKYGGEYSLNKPRLYKTKSKNAQEAHEAIRPTNLRVNISEHNELTASHQKLYNLIFNRIIATQMKEAQIKNTKVNVLGQKGYLFQTEWEKVLFKGYLVIYPQKKETIHKEFKNDQALTLTSLNFIESMTNPPPRYNEASLIKTLEERGIGRPSTYAPIVSTIQERQYVEKKDGRFFPTSIGIAVCNYLSKSFPNIFEINFTVNLEDNLDLIATGEKDMIQVLNNFYQPFQAILTKEMKSKEHIDVQEKTDEKCPECHHDLVFRYSRFGKFYACSNYPKCKFTKPYFEKIDKKCPKCQGDIIIKYTRRKKRFYSCRNYPKCDFAVWRLSELKRNGNHS